MDRIRGGPRGEPLGPPRSRPNGSVSSAAITPNLYSKADGRQRPLGIAALENKVVQAAVMAILTPIYEAEFLGFSYGFRPKRNQHQALDAPPLPAVLPKALPGSLTDKIPHDGKLRASPSPASMRTPYGVQINRRRDQPIEGTERGWRARSQFRSRIVWAPTSDEGGLRKAAPEQRQSQPAI